MLNPKISVIMGIFNCDSTLEESLDSLIAQTYQDFEIILCDDGSTDRTYKIALNYQNQFPDKIILLKNERNCGLNYTLNKCLKIAKGEYIARMDGDDISISNRLEIQNEFLDKNKKYAFVSSAMIYFDQEGEWGQSRPEENPNINDFVKGTPFAHAPTLIRKKAILAVEGYSVDERLLRVEDYHLWIKLYKSGFVGYNLKEVLYMMRDDRNAIFRRTMKNRLNEAYVKHLAIEMLNLKKCNYMYLIKPIIIIFVPKMIYKYLHKRKLKRRR